MTLPKTIVDSADVYALFWHLCPNGTEAEWDATYANSAWAKKYIGKDDPYAKAASSDSYKYIRNRGSVSSTTIENSRCILNMLLAEERIKRLWWLLKWLGHDAVAVLDGGWKAWTQAGLPATAVVPEPMPRTFVANVRPELLMAAGAVSQMRDDPTYRLIDARTPERYRGEQEPIDPVAGHSPGAVNVPFTGNIGPDGRFLTEDALRSRFTALFGTLTTQRVVSYCGSGVTGCHNLLAIAHAGLGDGVLYAGSWSEWIADPNRPIATGDP